jgi:hypothetical protein
MSTWFLLVIVSLSGSDPHPYPHEEDRATVMARFKTLEECQKNQRDMAPLFAKVSRVSCVEETHKWLN